MACGQATLSVLRPASGCLAKGLGVCSGEDARCDNNGQVLVAAAGSPVGAGDRSVLKRPAIAQALGKADGDVAWRGYTRNRLAVLRTAQTVDARLERAAQRRKQSVVVCMPRACASDACCHHQRESWQGISFSGAALCSLSCPSREPIWTSRRYLPVFTRAVVCIKYLSMRCALRCAATTTTSLCGDQAILLLVVALALGVVRGKTRRTV